MLDLHTSNNTAFVFFNKQKGYIMRKEKYFKPIIEVKNYKVYEITFNYVIECMSTRKKTYFSNKDSLKNELIKFLPDKTDTINNALKDLSFNPYSPDE